MSKNSGQEAITETAKVSAAEAMQEFPQRIERMEERLAEIETYILSRGPEVLLSEAITLLNGMLPHLEQGALCGSQNISNTPSQGLTSAITMKSTKEIESTKSGSIETYQAKGNARLDNVGYIEEVDESYTPEYDDIFDLEPEKSDDDELPENDEIESETPGENSDILTTEGNHE